MTLPWPVRSVLAGTAGTVALTLSYSAERRLRPLHHGPLDYDDSLVPGQIVAAIMRLPQMTAREYHQLGTALRWGYGSAFGLAHGLLRRRIREPVASAIFGGALMGVTFSLFPLLGHTPPPWRWRPDVIATCLGTHAAYVFTVANVDDGLRMRGRSTVVLLNAGVTSMLAAVALRLGVARPMLPAGLGQTVNDT